MDTQTQNHLNGTAGPRAARDPGYLNSLAKVVVQLTLVRRKMEMLVKEGVGKESVEQGARH